MVRLYQIDSLARARHRCVTSTAKRLYFNFVNTRAHVIPDILQQSSCSFLSGGGELGALMRAFDWSTTPLGHPDTWPSALKTNIRMLLSSNHPMFIWWGPELIQFYNDGYRRTMGPELHPRALGQRGRECWHETWHIIGPDIAFVMDGKGATWHEDTLVPFTRHGKREEVWWTYGFSPIVDESACDRVAGVLVICSEVTEKHQHAARLEESYESLVASMDYGFCVLDVVFDAAGHPVDYRYLQTNPAFEKQSGIVGAQGRSIKEIAPDIEEFWLRAYGDVARTGVSRRAMHRAAALGKWFEIDAFRIGPAGSNKVGVLFKDVTEQTLATEALRIGAARQDVSLRLADAVRGLTAPDDIVQTACLIMGSQLGVARVLYAEVDPAQDCFTVRLGWTRTGIAALPPTSFRLDDFGRDIVDALRRGEPMRVDDVRLDPRTASFAAAYATIGVRANLAIPLLKGGELVTILSLHDDVARAWSDDDVLVARDMAERTWSTLETARAQEQLRAERDGRQYIFASMREGFLLIDPDWTISYVNSAAQDIAQRARLGLLGQDYWVAVPGMAGTPVETLFRRVLQTRAPETIEHHHTFSNGRQGWLDIRVYPSLTGGLAVFFQDISDRKGVEEELRLSVRRKDEFLAMLAHELRNPLAPISAAAQLMTMVDLAPERVRQTSQVIQRQVVHMTALVDDLLDVSRVTQGLVDIKRSPQDMKTILTNAVEQARPLIEAQGHSLAITLAPQPAQVAGDAKRLVQVFANLLNNAAKYTPAGGTLRLTMEVRDDDVVVHVEDNGVGISAELLPYIFDIFTQGERSIDRATGGLGLGLALVKSLAELHGGSVACVSAGLGQGSRFTVRLPRTHAAGTEAPSGRAIEAASAAAPLRILLVDDNVDAANMLKDLLELDGHVVAVEHDPYRAIERAQHERIDVGVLDIGLPGMDGNALARHLLAQPETASMVCIAVTGYGREQDRDAALAAGFRYHLVKPVDVAQLNTLLAHLHPPQ
jgi:PAS domain S-box-containing protein